MRPVLILFLVYLSLTNTLFAQKDTTINVSGHYVTLSEIVINNKLNVPAFIERVKNDTTFYKAFRNLHILNYTSLNDIRMVEKKGIPQQQDKTGAHRQLPLYESASGNHHRRHL